MSRFFTIAFAAMLAACLGSPAWSQSGQSGGAGTAGSAGTGGTAGTAGTGGTASAAGTTANGQFSTSVVGQGQIGAGQQFGANTQAGASFNRFGQRPFFADPGAQRQLMLNNNQFNQLDTAYANALRNYNMGLSRLGNNLTEQQREQQMMALENQFNTNFNRSVDTTFTDPRLRNRFNQLNTQFQGVNAFSDPMVTRRLNLTPEQRRQFSRLSADWRFQLAQLRRAGNDANNPNAADAQQRFALLQQQFQQHMTALLTPEQQQIYLELTGQPYVFPWEAFNERPALIEPYAQGQGVPQVPRSAANPAPGTTTVPQQNTVR